MPDLAQGNHANVVLLPGDVYRVSTGGQATVQSAYGAPSGISTLNAETADFGPYGVPAKLRVTAVSKAASYALLSADQQEKAAALSYSDIRIIGANFGHQAAVSGGTSLSSTTLFTVPYDVTELILGFEPPSTVTQKYRCSVESPAGMTPISASVNGALEWTVDVNGGEVIAVAPIALKAGTTVLIHTKAEVVGGGDLRASEALLLAGESSSSYTDTTDYTRTAGQIPGGAAGRTDGPANVFTARPTWIAARRARSKIRPTLVGAGDSTMRGIGIPGVISAPALTQRLANWFAQGMTRTGQADWLNFSVSNERITSLFDGQNSGSATWSWRGKNAAWKFGDKVFSNLSTNDLSDRTGVQICTAIHDFAQVLYGIGKELIPVTNIPRTATTGNMWQAANQTAQFLVLRTFINTWMRNGFQMLAGVPVISGGVPSPYIRRFFDAAAAIEVNSSNVLTLNGGVWLCKSAPTYAGLTVTNVVGPASGVLTLTVSGGSLPAYNAVNSFGIHTMAAVMRSGAANGQSAIVAAGNLVNTVPLYTTGTASPTGVAVPGLTNTPGIGDTLDLYDIASYDGTHKTLWGATRIADAFEPWLYVQQLA